MMFKSAFIRILAENRPVNYDNEYHNHDTTGFSAL